MVVPEPLPMPWPIQWLTHATAVTTMPGKCYEVDDFPETPFRYWEGTCVCHGLQLEGGHGLDSHVHEMPEWVKTDLA